MAQERHEQLWIDTWSSDSVIGKLVHVHHRQRIRTLPDGQYRYDPADVEWARGVAARIRKLDVVHLIGCHPSVWITDQDAPGLGARPFGSYKAFAQRRPQVVWPLWEGSEVNLNVTQNNEGVQRRTWGDLDDGGRGLTYGSTIWQGSTIQRSGQATGWDFEAAGWRTASPQTGRVASRFSTPSSAISSSRDTKRGRAIRPTSSINNPRSEGKPGRSRRREVTLPPALKARQSRATGRTATSTTFTPPHWKRSTDSSRQKRNTGSYRRICSWSARTISCWHCRVSSM